tara:strand:- start:1515 stop:2327 length:813 start_codon:yes stop_codon:yes gene_type:complete
MNLNSLRRKKQGADKLELSQPTMMFGPRENVTIIQYHTVLEDEITRPDLIALEYYGNDSKLDLILKWNGISDPFSLNPGEVIEIPHGDTPFYKLERPSQAEDNPIKNQFVQSKRLSKKDQRRLEALKKKYNKETLLPPNVIPVGKKNYEFDGELVRFGAQVQNADVNDPVVKQVLEDITNDGAGVDDGNVIDVKADFLADSGSGGGRGELTETQLENKLTEGVGQGRTSSGSGGGTGLNADESATNTNSGDAPQSTNSADGVSNDGAPCK